jgi:outer membrane lipoprotein-sorting protein
MKRFLLACLLWLGIVGINQLGGTELIPATAGWLAAQTNVQSWSADFVQTRSLKSLVQPLTATGHVWFDAPNRFRWELGSPAQTIAVRASSELLVIYPKLKRVERFPLSGTQGGSWKDALALLEAGFPRSAAELESQYNILDQTIREGVVRLVLQPKSAAARRMMPQISIEFDPKDFSLKATELTFADGSSLRNDFNHAVLNPLIDPRQFSPPIPSEYKVVEPLKKQPS